MNVESDKPRGAFPRTPLEALGPIIREKVRIDSFTLLIDRPDDRDDTLNHPAVQAEFAVDEYLPYWTELWPAARMLAKVIVRETWPESARALEIGCGLGLPGIAALAKGLRVTFSDLDATALRFAQTNARLNGFQDFELLPMDWRTPPEDRVFDLILASDLVYELRNINPLVALIKKLLAPGGTCLLTDADRLPAYNLTDALIGEGLVFSTKVHHAGNSAGQRMRGTLYRITRGTFPL